MPQGRSDGSAGSYRKLGPLKATGAGIATQAGTSYQNRVAAWYAIIILAEQNATPPHSLPNDTVLTLLTCEASAPVDDIVVVTSCGGHISAQAKRQLSLSALSDSDFAKTIKQFVEAHLSAKSNGNPLDPTKDRLVLTTTSESPKSVRVALDRFLTRARSAPALDGEWKNGNRQEQDAAIILRSHVTTHWTTMTNTVPSEREIHDLIRLIYVQTLDLNDGQLDDVTSKERLRLLLHEPTQGETAWKIVVEIVADYATRRQSGDRSALETALAKDGIILKPARSFDRDIERLKNKTAQVLDSLQSHQVLAIGGAHLAITRTVADAITSAAETGHLVITGVPGIGKSGTVHTIARSLVQKNDLVVLRVDQLNADTPGMLQSDLHLDHDLGEVLAHWTGEAPAYIIIDALDAARTERSQATIGDLIRTVASAQGRWRVIASIRKFDLRYDAQIRQAFRGSPPNSDFCDVEFSGIRHVNIGLLTEEEIVSLNADAPALAEIIANAPTVLHELLRIPFNLQLVADLFTEGVTAQELLGIRTQTELLGRYWMERIVGADGRGDEREMLLKRAVSMMVQDRARVVAATVATGPQRRRPRVRVRLHPNGNMLQIKAWGPRTRLVGPQWGILTH